MNVAVAQLMSGPDKAENLAKAQNYISKAKQMGADLVLIPEGYMVYLPGTSDLKKADVAEPIDGVFVSGLQKAARENQIYVICGVYESDPNDKVRAFNTTVFLDRQGKILQRYRKTHLYDAFTRKESNNIIPGDEPFAAVETEFGKVGIMVCYELRFPEICRQFVFQGADIVFVPTAWVGGAMKEEHFETFVKARAIENTAYICASDQVGNGYIGRSLMVDPMGVVLASAGEEEALFMATIDLNRIKRVRDKLPCLNHRRPELYPLR